MSSVAFIPIVTLIATYIAQNRNKLIVQWILSQMVEATLTTKDPMHNPITGNTIPNCRFKGSPTYFEER